MLPDRELNETQAAATAVATVEVAFRGAAEGVLIVRICGDVLPVIAANMLGEDQAPDPRIQRDALGEIANVICGNVLPSLAGPQAAYQLDAPRVVPADEGDSSSAAAPTVRIGLDDGRADLWLLVRQPVEA